MNSSDRLAWQTKALEKDALNRRWNGYKLAWSTLFVLMCFLWIYLILGPFGLPRTHIITLGNGKYSVNSLESIPFVELEKQKLSNIHAVVYHNQDEPDSRTNVLKPEIKTAIKSKDSVVIFLYFRCAAINGKPYFINSEFKLGKLKEGLLPVEAVLNEISNLPSKNKLVVIPAGSIHYDPRIGVFTDNFQELLGELIEKLAKEKEKHSDRTITVYFPNENFEASSTSILLSSSLTTHFFCEGIKGVADYNQDKKIDIREISSYISHSLYNWINESNTDEPYLWSPQNASLFSSYREEDNAEEIEKEEGARNVFWNPKIQKPSPPTIYDLGNKQNSKEDGLRSKINSSHRNLFDLINSRNKRVESSIQSTNVDSNSNKDQTLKERERRFSDWLRLESLWKKADNLAEDRTKKFPYANFQKENVNLKKAFRKSILKEQQTVLEDLQASTFGIASDRGSEYGPPIGEIDFEKIFEGKQYGNGELVDKNLGNGSNRRMHSLSLEVLLQADRGEYEKPIEAIEELLTEKTPDKLKDWLESNGSLNQFSEVNWANHVLNRLDIEWKDAQILIRTRILSEKVSAMDAALPNVFRGQIEQLDRSRLQSEVMIHKFRLDACTLQRFIDNSIKLQHQYQLLLEDFETLISGHRVWLSEFETAEDVLRLYCNPYSIQQPDVSFDLISDWIKQLRDLNEILNGPRFMEYSKGSKIQNLTRNMIETGNNIRSKLFQPTVNSKQNSDDSIHKLPFDRQLLNCTSIPTALQKEHYLDVIDEEYHSALAYMESDLVTRNEQIPFSNFVDEDLKKERLLRQLQRTILYLRYLGLIKPLVPSQLDFSTSKAIQEIMDDLNRSETVLVRQIFDLEVANELNEFSELDQARELLKDAGEKVSRFFGSLSNIGPPRSDDNESEFQMAKAASLFTDWRDAYNWIKDPTYSPNAFCLDAVIAFQSKRLSEQLLLLDGMNSTWVQEWLEAYSEYHSLAEPSDEADAFTSINLDVPTDPVSLRHETESHFNLLFHNEGRHETTFRLLIVFDTDCIEVEPTTTEASVPFEFNLSVVQDSATFFPPKGSLLSNPFLLMDQTSMPIRFRVARRASAKGTSTPIDIFLLASGKMTKTSSDSWLQNEDQSSRLVLRRSVSIELPHGEIQYIHLNQMLVTKSYVTTETLFPNQSHAIQASVPMQSTCESGLFAEVFPIDVLPASRTVAQWRSWLSTQKPLLKITASDSNPTDNDSNQTSPQASIESNTSSAMTSKLKGFTGLLFSLGYSNDESRTLRFIDFDIARPQEYLIPKISFDSNINRLRIDLELNTKSNRLPLGAISVHTRFIDIDPKTVTGKKEITIIPNQNTSNRLQFEFSDPMPQTVRLEIDVDHFPRAFVYSVDSRETRLDIPSVSSLPNLEIEGLNDRLFLSMTQADKLTAKVDLRNSGQEFAGQFLSVVQESTESGFEPVGIAKITDDRQTELELTVLPIPGTVRIDSHVSDFQLSFPPDALFDRPTRLVARIAGDESKPIRSVPLFIDTQPPTIESLDLPPGTKIVSVGETIELNIGVADKGSGVASVELVAIGSDIDEPPADAKWTPATFETDNTWKCSISTGEKEATLQLFVRATDVVGNFIESRLSPIIVSARGKSEVEKTLKLFGRVLHRGKPVDSGTVSLVAETKNDLKTNRKEIRASINSSGSYVLDRIPKGKYTATVKLVINNKVILSKQELDLSDPKSVDINQDFSTDKAPR